MTRLRPAVALVGGFAVAVALASCSSNYGAPDSATEEGDRVLDQWRVLLLLAAILGGIVVGLLGYAVVRYRRRQGDDELPPQVHGKAWLEAVYVTVPALTVAGLFAYTIWVEDEVTAGAEDPGVVVDVVGYRWGWTFEYPDEGIVVESGPDEDPRLVLPVGESVRLRLDTADVIHSFFVPEFLRKQDLTPRTENDLEVVLNRTGSFQGYCAEFCGLSHSQMNFRVDVVEPEAYERWVADQAGGETAQEPATGPGRVEQVSADDGPAEAP